MASAFYRIAEATLDNPDGRVSEVIFPVADQQTIENLVKEFRANGPAFQKRVYTSSVPPMGATTGACCPA